MRMTNLASLQLTLWNILKKHGQSPEEVFWKVGLNPELMHQKGKRYPIRKTDLLWAEAETRISDPCFGLDAADCWHPSHLGILGYAMLGAASLRIALEQMIRFHRVVSDNRFADLTIDSGNRTLIFTMREVKNSHLSACREDAAMAMTMAILQLNYQQELIPAGVSFRHPSPVCAASYDRLFNTRVQFNAPHTCLLLPLDVAQSHLSGTNRDLATLGEQLMTDYLARLDDEQQIEQIKKLIVRHLPTGDAQLENIAHDLSTSTRTLQRQLSRQGTSFIHLLNQTRKELAQAYVRDRDRNLTEVAYLLGFSELSTFSRSFKRWTGKSPSRYRQQSEAEKLQTAAR